MDQSLQQFARDHRYLLEMAGRAAQFADPVAIELDEFADPLFKAARKGEFVPVDGVLVRDWDPHTRDTDPGIRLGVRLYELDGVRFAYVRFQHEVYQNGSAQQFAVVDRKHYRQLYRLALRCRRNQEPQSAPPVLSAAQRETLWANTIGYLEERNLERIRKYGGRARRGVLLAGPPGNGKTMACRWIWQECRERNWEWKMVTPDTYRAARGDGDAEESLRELFSVGRRGVIFFDDMDLALRDRETVHETEDQSIFLTALDGIAVKEGVVFLFTSNCALHLIDRAFQRPGRIDVVLQFQSPDAALRRELLDRWHPDILAGLDRDKAIQATEGFSFAEIEEVKTLLIVRFLDGGGWDWDRALRHFSTNRQGFAGLRPRRLGFDGSALERNGTSVS